ncbi:contact-dependent growth inhibition system immunity protein [Streptomyces sp. NBC_01443]|uniref:contact-dependent growth inhibition system immunity protein n=1 Tax=Streptomyces sp. NBC_01443 TaxID=2903868 RepID=UPI002B1CD60E|nr:contact-dependent growth inhibition system immunity protein [Streptomyces sp. NBC_01443]
MLALPAGRAHLGEARPRPALAGLSRRDGGGSGALVQLADHIKQSIERGEVPRPSELPETRWEWHARFPELGQFLGGWFSQDMPDEFTDHEAAVRDYAVSTDRTLVARVVGEIRELLALGLDEADHAVAVAELGMELEPPGDHSAGSWLSAVADELSGFRPKHV